MQARLVGKILSGGQTGVDRAALDWALDNGLPCGGWCPRGRRAEDGPLARRYPLQETPTGDYAQRTEWNVRDADGTLILATGRLEGGTRLTAAIARQQARPLWIARLDKELDVAGFRLWLQRENVELLNIAGPRESKARGVHRQAYQVLQRLLAGVGPC